MEKIPLTRALWTCLETEFFLQDLLTTLTDFKKQLPEDSDPFFIDVPDDFHSLESRVKSIEYDLMICIRKYEQNQH